MGEPACLVDGAKGVRLFEGDHPLSDGTKRHWGPICGSCWDTANAAFFGALTPILASAAPAAPAKPLAPAVAAPPKP